MTTRKIQIFFIAAALAGTLLTMPAQAAGLTHTVTKGDTMWKLAVRYQAGTSEIIQANPQVSNPDLIYPGQVLNIPQISQSVLSYESEVIRLVNEVRRENGLKALTANWELSRVARYKSQDMLNKGYFSHTSPTYGTPFQMIKAFGLSFRTAGENIARGYPTPQAVVNGWMNSSGHRANILNASYTQIGVGYVAQGNYWTQMFIGS
ncbi:SafA/ExsA family spore coat assembly protein [Pusillibacter faecalis]